MNLAKDTEFASQAYAKNSRYRISVRIKLPGGQSALLEADPYAPNCPFLRFSFNPSKIGYEGFEAIKIILESLLPFGYPQMFVYGRISRIDVTVDVFGIHISNVQFFPTKATKTTRFYGTSGQLETVYHGTPRSSNQWRVYDKSQEQFDKKGIIPKQPWTRFERQLRHQGRLSNITNLKNPFTSLHVVDCHLLAPPIKDYVWQFFLDSVALRGLDNALAQFPKVSRAKVRAALKANQEPWWNPVKIWEQWPALLGQYGLLTDVSNKSISADPDALGGGLL